MYRIKRPSIISRLKGLISLLKNLRSRPNFTPVPVPSFADFDGDLSTQIQNLMASSTLSIYNAEPRFLYATDIYLPSDGQTTFRPSKKSASVADLCSNLGPQLPLQLVKLVARDVLRALNNFYCGTDKLYRDINKHNVLLSTKDLRALVSQLRADTQTSLTLSQLSVRGSFYQHGDEYNLNGELVVPPDTTAPVFTLRLPLKELAEDDCMQADVVDGQQALRPPEVLLGAPCSISTDVWTLGCFLFELLTGDSLFDPVFQTAELDISKEESHLIQMIELLGDIPTDLVQRGKLSSQWFTEDGLLRIDTTYFPIKLTTVLEKHVEARDLEGTAEFLGMMLKLRPEDRAKPAEIIDHPWFSS